MKAINLQNKLALFDKHWDPHVVAAYNDNDVMVVKFKGEPNSGDADRVPAPKPQI